MKRTMIFIVCSVVLLFMATNAFAQGKGKGTSGILDGMVFYAELGENGKKAYTKDTLTFANGFFHSSECDQYGFRKGKYKASKNGEVISFETITESPKEGKMTWKGTVKSGEINIDYVWEKKGQPKLDYWATGKLKKK